MRYFYVFLILMCLDQSVLCQRVERNPQTSVKSNNQQPKEIQADTVLVKHFLVEQNSTLIFSNHLFIPKENYARFFERMMHLYPVIGAIHYHEREDEMELNFNVLISDDKQLFEILSKFSLKHYRLTAL